MTKATTEISPLCKLKGMKFQIKYSKNVSQSKSDLYFLFSLVKSYMNTTARNVERKETQKTAIYGFIIASCM